MKNNESGFSFLQVLISMGSNSILIIVGVMLFSSLVHNFISAIGDWELLEEVRQIAGQIRSNTRYADSVKVEENSLSLTNTECITGSANTVTYRIVNFNKRGILYRNGQPINDASRLGAVKINRFEVRKRDKYTVHMILEGINALNGHTFKLETDILCYALMGKDEIR